MQRTPQGLRLHIGLFGQRNVGKSSLLNAITDQTVSIVSEIAGTTTDPVRKPMELRPLGPVLFVDTAGIDDEGALGSLRVDRTRKVLERTDLGVIVSEAGRWCEFEERLLAEMSGLGIPVIAVFNKRDLARPSSALREGLESNGLSVVETSAPAGIGIPDLRQALLDKAPADFVNQTTILADLVGPGETTVLVTPIDKEAPRGRLIMPQVQSIRDLLDHDRWCVVVQDAQLRDALRSLARPPRLVVTDSQAFERVAAIVPREVLLTSFSILFSRFKGDLTAQAQGAMSINSLRPGDRVLIAEACSHHPIEDDIGRVQIPRKLEQQAGGKLEIDFVRGHDLPDDLSPYRLVIHCGACTFNRREMLGRILRCQQSGVPISNYGLTLAYTLGILGRALEPFPGTLEHCPQATLKSTTVCTCPAG